MTNHYGHNNWFEIQIKVKQVLLFTKNPIWIIKMLKQGCISIGPKIKMSNFWGMVLRPGIDQKP